MRDNKLNFNTNDNRDVSAIIASFRNEQGKLINYSQRTPQIFGYNKN
jgi:hypothetical protein